MGSTSRDASRHNRAADGDKSKIVAKEIRGDKSKFVVEEIPGFLRIYNDGSVERLSSVVREVPASCEEYDVGCKDVKINYQTGVWARLYVPHPKQMQKMPLVFYFHGGGFCVGSTAWSTCHGFLCRFCWEANCIIISVNYRLAPEHRLPAAYDDCFAALEWIRRQTHGARTADPPAGDDEVWVRSYADVSRCFLAGESAGGNIAHHVAVRCVATDLKPLRIRGVILIQPFFGRQFGGPTKSELEVTDPALPLRWTDLFWKLSLPVGADKDDPWCNPVGIISRGGQDLSLPPILLLIAEGDVLRDMDLEYYGAMKRANKSIRHVIYSGVGHAFHLISPHSHSARQILKDLAIFLDYFSSPPECF